MGDEGPLLAAQAEDRGRRVSGPQQRPCSGNPPLHALTPVYGFECNCLFTRVITDNEHSRTEKLHCIRILRPKNRTSRRRYFMRILWRLLLVAAIFSGTHPGITQIKANPSSTSPDFSLHIGPPHQVVQAGSQVQIWDPENPGEVKNGAPKGSGALWNDNANNPGKWPLVKADNPVGQWNTLHIKMVGTRVWVWLNDKQTVNGSISSSGRPSKNRRRTTSICPLDACVISSQPRSVIVISVARRSLGDETHPNSLTCPYSCATGPPALRNCAHPWLPGSLRGNQYRDIFE